MAYVRDLSGIVRESKENNEKRGERERKRERERERNVLKVKNPLYN